MKRPIKNSVDTLLFHGFGLKLPEEGQPNHLIPAIHVSLPKKIVGGGNSAEKQLLKFDVFSSYQSLIRVKAFTDSQSGLITLG